MLTRLKYLLELIRFSHTIFALPFALLAALMAAWMSSGTMANPPIAALIAGIVLCMVFARSAAMAFNRIVDCSLDARNPRTKNRHIPAGLLSTSTVLAFCLFSAIGFIVATLLFTPNRLPFYLSVPVLLFLLGYSYAKRFTALSHFWLGAALMLAPVCTWIAFRGQEVMQNPSDLMPAVMLGGAVLLWVAGFDIIYACQDVEFDRQAGLHSVPAKIGVKNALRLAAICHCGMIVLLAVLPWFFPPFGWVYWSGIAAVAVLLIYEHSLVRPDDLTRVNMAFFQVNAVVSIGLFVVGALDLLT